MIEEYNKNIENALSMLKEISLYGEMKKTAKAYERRAIEQTEGSLKNKLKMIVNSIPTILNQVSIAKKLPGSVEKETNLEKISFDKQGKKIEVSVDKKYKENFIDEVKNVQYNSGKIQEVSSNNSRTYVKIANKFFIKFSQDLVNKGNFKDLSNDLKKSNIDVITESYISMSLFTSALIFILGVFGVLFIGIFGQGNVILGIIKFIWLPFLLGGATFLLMYIYPSTEKKDNEKKINQELPFAVVNMSAIAGSGIEPIAIFKIISNGREYPHLRKELRKILNHINIYGYDLVSALNLVSRNSPSQKLAELLTGLSTTITSGGNLNDFFEKRAETLLLDYKLEREKFTKMAETSMDLYITVVIAAPMILLLIFVLLSVSDFAISISPQYITFIIIALIGIVNLIFIWILNLKQPAY